MGFLSSLPIIMAFDFFLLINEKLEFYNDYNFEKHKELFIVVDKVVHYLFYFNETIVRIYILIKSICCLNHNENEKININKIKCNKIKDFLKMLLFR